MKKIDLTHCNHDIHFPIVQAVHDSSPRPGWLTRVFKFATFRRKFCMHKHYLLWIPWLKKYVFIPAEFLYDNASVPKLLNGIYNSDGVLLLGAPIHDFGYRYERLFFVDPIDGSLYLQRFTKKELDTLFNELCAYESGMKVASRTATFVLKLAGFTGWKENRKLNLDLECDFPELFVET